MIAYCGVAAVPDDFWTRWNGDPLLLAALAALAFAVVRGWSANTRAGWGALALLLVIFVSPLCALASALFSARVLHHVLLIAIAAPLLAVAFPLRRMRSPGRPKIAYRSAQREGEGHNRSPGRPKIAYRSAQREGEDHTGSFPLALLVAAQAVILWFWHAPGIYEWGLATVPAYWLMQGSLLASAWLMWRAILAPSTHRAPALLALVATIGQMGLLGALLAFAPRPLYLVHLASTTPWGLTPLADQQLAGLLMWVPAILPYLAVGLWLAWSSLRPLAPAR